MATALPPPINKKFYAKFYLKYLSTASSGPLLLKQQKNKEKDAVSGALFLKKKLLMTGFEHSSSLVPKVTTLSTLPQSRH